MKMKRAIFPLLAIFASIAFIVVPASSGPPYYHEEGNVNYSGSYFETAYISGGIGTDDYITMMDGALISRAFGTDTRYPWGIGWNEYNPDADINGDGKVWGYDLFIFGKNWGLNYHDTTPFEYEDNPANRVKIYPPTVATKVGDVFVIDVQIRDVDSLNMWEAKIWWSAATNVNRSC